MSIDPTLLADLPGDQGRVHSVFETALNVVVPGGLYSLAAGCHPCAPRTMVLDTPSLSGLGLAAGQSVRVRDGVLSIGDKLVVQLEGAVAWEPRPPQGPVTAEGLTMLRDALDDQGVRGGAMSHYQGNAFDMAVGRIIERSLANLQTAVRANDATAAAAAAGRLIGLGTGLTPAGDDVLTGFLFAAHHLELGERDWLHGIDVVLAGAGTHEVSLQALRQARQGRAVNSLHALLEAVCDCPSAVEAALVKLLAIGHTSGTDLACGLLAAAELPQRIAR